MNGALAGENNGHAKLTRRRVEILRSYYFTNKRPRGAPRHYSWVTPNEIAEKIKMATSAVRDMLEGRTWR